MKYKPLISIIMPVFNVEVKWIKEAINSIKDQIYTNWELCIADDASTNQDLKKYLETISKDAKIKVVFRKTNGHISKASNSALELATGEFIVLMDNDDIIHPHALLEVVKVLNKKKDTDFIYSDEDKLDMEGKRVEPFYKPDWSPDLFLSTNYICHLTAIRKNIVDKVGGFREGYEGSQDYDLFLRVTEKTNNIEHIPDILYSWRKIPGSTAAVYDDKNYAERASLEALKDTVERRSLNATVEKGLFPGSFRVKYNIEGEPLVSILILSFNNDKSIKKCISSLFEKTTYENFEVIIIDVGRKKKRISEYYKFLGQNSKITFLSWDKEFNHSYINNYAVENAKGEYIVLLADNTEIISPNWIQGMLEHVQRENIGAVGVKLYSSNKRTYHCGIVLQEEKGQNILKYPMQNFGGKILGIPYTKDIIRNYSVVSLKCLMVKKEKYLKMKGFNNNLKYPFNEVDFCLKLGNSKLFNVYTPYVELYLHNKFGIKQFKEKILNKKSLHNQREIIKSKWHKIIKEDPFNNYK